MPLIGVMIASSAATSVRNIAAFRNGLRELGYTDGRNVRIEYRSAEGMAERYPAIITDLVALNPACHPRRLSRRSVGRARGDTNDPSDHVRGCR
jgi:hypothetical protein